MAHLLEVENLSVELGSRQRYARVLSNASFSIDQGETLCIVGESGCGKSTTALSLLNLLPPHSRRTADRLLFEGQDLLKLSGHAMNALRGNRVSMIFQEPMTSLNPCFAIGNQLEETMLRHRPVSRREARDRAVQLLERTGIDNAAQRMQQFPHQLSGGMRQRVMIAMALMCSPALLIADEPTTALDVTVQVQILSLLKQLSREFSMGLLLITHDLGVVAHMADRVAVMYAGRIVEAGAVGSVIREPKHPYTRGLLSCIPRRGQRGTRLGVIPGSASTAPADEGCPFRNRCEFVAPICETGPIPVFEVPPDHRYVCRLEPRP